MAPPAQLKTGRPRRDVLVDGAIAAIVFVAVLIGYLVPDERSGITGAFVAGIALLVVMHAALVWRRRAPLLVLAVTTATFVFYATLDRPYVSPFALAVAIYTVAAYTDVRTAAAAGALAWAAVVGGNWLQTRDNVQASDMVSIGVALAVAWIVGARIGASRARTAALEVRAEDLERERDERAREAAAEERSRISRELHDVVSHNLSVIVVQAGGARRIAEDDPTRAREALGSIETTGRQALNEMRRLLGLIRTAGSGEPELEPASGVDALEELVDGVRRAGTTVELDVAGDRVALPPGIDISVYRIVQESLTNVMKHAAGARARVRVLFRPDAVDLVVADDGLGAAPGANADGRGQGLAGMRERVSLFGGEFRAGPGNEGGFEVHARLPLKDQR